MKKIKITGIKKAIIEFNDWISYDWRRRANIMLNTSTGEVWTDCFLDCNTWKEYHDKSIVSLLSYIRERTDEKITMNLLKEYAEIIIIEKGEYVHE